MKILILGSKGFIGSYISDYFSRDLNYEVFESDVVFDYVKKNYFLIDATNSDFQPIFRNFSFDACINCSGAASVPNSLVNPLQDFSLNTVNVFKLLEAIRQFQPNCKFLNLSSAAVYGNPEQLPIRENDAVKPISPYGLHKMFAEEICCEFNSFYNIPTCSLRIFSAYGIGLKKQLLWDSYQKFKSAQNVEIFGTGKETRDFINIEDLANAIHLSLLKAAFTGESINIASGIETSSQEIAMHYQQRFPIQRKFFFNQQSKTGDPINWRADVSKLNSFGFLAKKNIGAGIKEYIDWASTYE